jgi:hypothetical protein
VTVLVFVTLDNDNSILEEEDKVEVGTVPRNRGINSKAGIRNVLSSNVGESLAVKNQTSISSSCLMVTREMVYSSLRGNNECRLARWM